MKQSSKIRVANTSEAECRIVNGTQNACSEVVRSSLLIEVYFYCLFLEGEGENN